jgi:hypothetical protein
LNAQTLASCQRRQQERWIEREFIPLTAPAVLSLCASPMAAKWIG